MSLSPLAKRSLNEQLVRVMQEQHRRLLRRSLTAFATEAIEPFGHAPAAHHRLLIRELEAIASGDNDRLMVMMPPGSAKSTYASKLFPAWFLAQEPNLSVIGASHTASLAEIFSKDVQRFVRDNAATLGYGLATESVERWTTTNGGAYRSAGVGGALTGIRADLGIIDDPVKSRAEADSETYRETTWDWFNSVFRTRLKPGGRMVLIMTRWHMDDLAGRLLSVESDRWRVVSLPAIAEENDALGRIIGEPLWGDDAYGYGAELRGKRADYEAAGAMRDWYALYQQSPVDREGALFKVAQIATMPAAPAGRNAVVRAWDLAATEQTGTRDPDWTVGVKMARTEDGRFVVLDVTRLRGGPDEVEAAIVNTAHQDGYGVRIGLPQDPGQAGKTQVLYFTRKLAGYRIESSPETGDKATRAAPFASQVNVGNVSVVQEMWNRAYLDELASFPSGAKDDMVDASSRAFGKLIARVPLAISAETLKRSAMPPPRRLM